MGSGVSGNGGEMTGTGPWVREQHCRGCDIKGQASVHTEGGEQGWKMSARPKCRV
jgi:hypothetical protein